MHFRIRKNVVQLVRTRYVPGTKKPEAQVVARLPLADPQLTDELTALLTPAELDETRHWIDAHHRVMALKEELAAFELAANMAQAARWLRREQAQPAALRVAAEIREGLQPLRKILRALLDE